MLAKSGHVSYIFQMHITKMEQKTLQCGGADLGGFWCSSRTLAKADIQQDTL